MTDRDLAIMIKNASTETEKRAALTHLIFGGMMLLPLIKGYLMKQQQESFAKGLGAMGNIMTPALYAQGPQGALGMPNVYRSRYGMEPMNTGTNSYNPNSGPGSSYA